MTDRGVAVSASAGTLRLMPLVEADPWGGKPGPNFAQVGPDARKKLSPLIRHYMKKPHPFTSCVRDNTKRFGKERAERVCAVLKDLGHGGTGWRKGGKRKMQEAVEDALLALHEAGVRDAYSVALIEEFMLSQLEPEDRLLVEGQQLAEAHIEGAARGSAGPDPFRHELDEAKARVAGYVRKGERGKVVRVKQHERATLYPNQNEEFKRRFERPTLYPDPNAEFRRRQAAERDAVRDTSSMQDWAAEQARKRREGGGLPPPASPGTGLESASPSEPGARVRDADGKEWTVVGVGRGGLVDVRDDDGNVEQRPGGALTVTKLGPGQQKVADFQAKRGKPKPPASPGTEKRSATERTLLDNPGVAPLYGQESKRAAAQRLDDLGLGKYDAVADTFTKVASPRSPGTGAKGGGRYSYTLAKGDKFKLPGDDQVRTVASVKGKGVNARITDDSGEEHDPGTVVQPASGVPPEPKAGTPEFEAARARTAKRNMERYGKSAAHETGAPDKFAKLDDAKLTERFRKLRFDVERRLGAKRREEVTAELQAAASEMKRRKLDAPGLDSVPGGWRTAAPKPPASPGTEGGAPDPSKVAVGDKVSFSVGLPASARTATRRDYRPETGKVVGVTKSGYRIQTDAGDTLTVPKKRVQNFAAKQAAATEKIAKHRQERAESEQFADELKPGDDIEFSNEDTGFARERGRVTKVTKSTVTVEMTDPIDGGKTEFSMLRKVVRAGKVRRRLAESGEVGVDLARAHVADSARLRGSAQPVPFS